MRRVNPDYVKRAVEEVNGCPYFSLLSMEIVSLDYGESRLEVAVQEKHLQPFGQVHGGVYSSLVDATAFWAVYAQIEEGVGMTTVELKLNYLAPASAGVLVGKGKSLRVGHTLCLGEARIEDQEGQLLAHGTSTMMILKDLKLQGETGWPAKFLKQGGV